METQVQVTLYYREGSSDKVYQCAIEPAGDLFVVNFAYGRRGSTLNTGTKTSSPVDHAEARRIYDKLVKEKKAKGYTAGADGTPYQHSERKAAGLVPQLLNPIEADEVPGLIENDDWCAQEKFNGKRLLVRKQNAAIEGINKQGVVVGLPEPLFRVIQQYGAEVVLDGESIGDTFHVFDLLVLDGVDIRGWPYRERLTALMNWLAPIQQRAIKLVETAFTPQQKLQRLEQLRVGKREGIVFKQVNAPYTSGRPNSGGTQLKHKFCATLSAVVANVNQRRSVELQLLGHDGWQTCGNVTIPANHIIPKAGEVVEVRYLYAHRESGVLYQPIYLGPRGDVNDHECQVSQLKFKPED
ncbi:MAG: WGR domain-containing protein [Verrucomicrobia bacterium]|nr:WGR domain-containing protein [Verrucomicrobiota bacterium]